MPTSFSRVDVNPPYSSAEIAEAILTAVDTGAPFALLDIVADETSGTWLIRTCGPDQIVRRHFFPFSTPRGISTPSEIARLMIEDRWPFGQSS